MVAAEAFEMPTFLLESPGQFTKIREGVTAETVSRHTWSCTAHGHARCGMHVAVCAVGCTWSCVLWDAHGHVHLNWLHMQTPLFL